MSELFQISLSIEDPILRYALMARARGLSWEHISSEGEARFGKPVNRQQIVSKLGKMVLVECKKNKGIALTAINEMD